MTLNPLIKFKGTISWAGWVISGVLVSTSVVGVAVGGICVASAVGVGSTSEGLAVGATVEPGISWHADKTNTTSAGKSKRENRYAKFTLPHQAGMDGSRTHHGTQAPRH